MGWKTVRTGIDSVTEDQLLTWPCPDCNPSTKTGSSDRCHTCNDKGRVVCVSVD